MTTLLWVVLTGVICFLLGAWVTKHPDDARSIMKRVGDRMDAWIKRLPGKSEGSNDPKA